MSMKFYMDRRQVMAGMAAAGFAGGFYPRAAISADGKVLRVRSYSDIQNLDPAFRKAAPEDDIMRNIFCGLVQNKTGTEWGWELDAASAIKQVDDKHIEFTLREGLKWTDGYGEVTAEDVKYSYERIADPKMESPYKGDWSALDRVEVKDKLSGVIVLKEAYVPLWSTSLTFGSGNIVSKAAVEKAGGKFDTKPPAQCGRYVMKEWLPKQRVVLARNADWPGNPAPFEEVHVLPIEDEKTAELAFESGELDYTWISASTITRYQKEPPKDSKVEVKPSLAYIWMGISQYPEELKDSKVRRAIQHGVDVKSVLEAAYYGVAEPATGIIAPGLVGHRDKVLYSYDPDKARALLKEAGKESLSLTLDLLNTQDFLNAAQAIQASLADVGVNVTIQQHDSGTFWSLGDEKSGESWKKIQLILGRFSMQPDPSFATEWFTPEQIGVWNWERFDSPEFGELHNKAKAEQDSKKRHDMYVKMQDLMEESGSYVFLTHGVTGLVYKNSIVAATMPHGAPIFHKFAVA
ncbi:MAG: ABC transporter substrate-binding protein [Parvibaculaceae bacterium]